MAVNGILSPFSEASGRRLLDTCSFSDSEIPLWAVLDGERARKGVDIGRQTDGTTGARDTWFHFVLRPVAKEKASLSRI